MMKKNWKKKNSGDTRTHTLVNHLPWNRKTAETVLCWNYSRRFFIGCVLEHRVVFSIFFNTRKGERMRKKKCISRKKAKLFIAFVLDGRSPLKSLQYDSLASYDGLREWSLMCLLLSLSLSLRFRSTSRLVIVFPYDFLRYGKTYFCIFIAEKHEPQSPSIAPTVVPRIFRIYFNYAPKNC